MPLSPRKNGPPPRDRGRGRRSRPPPTRGESRPAAAPRRAAASPRRRGATALRGARPASAAATRARCVRLFDGGTRTLPRTPRGAWGTARTPSPFPLIATFDGSPDSRAGTCHRQAAGAHWSAWRHRWTPSRPPGASLPCPTPRAKLVCVACAHRCKLAEGARGVCLVRKRAGNAILVPWGYAAGVAVDPVEKKPFFHLLPGARALSFGMLGCDLHCSYCQNWFTSQALRDPRAGDSADAGQPRGVGGGGGRAALRDHRLDLQRASDHRRVGARRLRSGAAGRAS